MSGTRRKAGLLGPQVEGYRAWLAQRGYTPGTVRNMLKDLGQVGGGCRREGLEASQLDEERMAGVPRRPARGRSPADPGASRDGAAAELSAGGRRRRGGAAVADPAGRAARAVSVLDGRGAWPGRDDGAALREHRTPLPAGTGVGR